MSVSISAMGLAELAVFLVENGSFATVNEALTALSMATTEGVGITGTAIAVSGGPAQVVVGTVGETALEVAAQAELAASGTNVTTAGIGLLQGETTTGAAALLGMDLGIVGAACAPILGVSLGVGLYESNPELWTKISQKLLPFCYPGTTKIPTWGEIVNDVWQVSVAKEVVDALKELFDEEGIPTGGETPQGTGSVIIDDVSYHVSTGGTTTSSGWIISDYDYGYSYEANPSMGYFVKRTNSPILITYSTGEVQNYPVTRAQTTNGTIYYRAAFSTSGSMNIPYIPSNIGRRIIEDAVIDGTVTPDTPAEYPDGTSEWTGTTPAEIPTSKPAVIGIDTTGDPITQTMVPISPPITAPQVTPQPAPEIEPQTIPFPWPEPSTDPHTTPWPTEMPWPLPETQPSWWPEEIPYPYEYPTQYPSADPLVQPNPDTVTDPGTQVQPYILPLPLPYEIPIPTTDPNPDPKLDPTTPRPTTRTGTDAIPPISLGPSPTGISPWPSMPSTPLAFSQGGGLVTVYHPTSAQLYAFEQWLWVTYADSTIDKIFNNPFDGVITLFELYCTPTDVGNQNIKSGFLDSGINSAVISRYTEIDCGTIGIPEYYGNYLDYSPYSKAHVYLPFIGVVELNVDDIVGHAVNITYRIDEYNGACIAMITVAKVTEVNGEDVEYSNTMYQFSGNCAVELPLAGGSQAAIKAGMMQANAYQNAANISAGASLIGGIGSLLLGSIGGAISGVGQAASSYMYGQANALSNMLSGKSTVQKSGSFGSSHGALGIKTPFITITRPKQIQVPNYNDLYGYPAHRLVYVGDCTGFLRCREVHVISATANDEEKNLIEQLLKTGVYVTE